MSDRERDDHWDFLASDLGAAPAPEEESKVDEEETPETGPEPEVAEVPAGESPEPQLEDEPGDTKSTDSPPERQRGRTGDRVVSGFGYRRRSVDWANLARELGVAPLEEAPEPIPASESDPASAAELVPSDSIVLDESESVVESEPAERPSRAGRSSARRKRPPKPNEGSFGAGLIEELEVELPSGDAQDEQAETDEPQDERKGRRRRRRKPRKQDQDIEISKDAAPAEAEVAEKPSPDRDESEESKSRRRGRRRGGRKRAPREQQEAQADGFASGLEAVEVGSEGSESYELFEEGLLQEPEDSEDESTTTKKRGSERPRDKDRDAKRKKITHRGIPSWDEAVGHIIDSNMEGRSKRPEPAGYRQRPGRRRGGDRSSNRG